MRKEFCTGPSEQRTSNEYSVKHEINNPLPVAFINIFPPLKIRK